MANWIYVGIGGFAGSVARYWLSGLVYRWLDSTWLPWGTLAVNILGCLLIGLLAGLADVRQLLSAQSRLLLMVGFLGGFTTFSTFGYELFTVAREGQVGLALLNMGLHIVLGVAAVWLGYGAARAL